MTKIERPTFTPAGSFFARRAFKFHNHSFKVDDPFPWRRLSCSVRRLRQLFEAGYLKLSLEGHDEAYLEEAGAPTIEPSAPAPGDTSGDEAEALVYDPERHTFFHDDDGSWYLMEGETQIARIRASVAKKLQKAEAVAEIDPKHIIEEDNGD